MDIIPAIDLRGGKCVRLYQGDYSQEMVFSDDPVSMAVRWQDAGAKRLHLVDLDGAAEGKLCNASVIEKIVKRVDLPIQVGGGIRTIETMDHLIRLGVKRVILGTIALEEPDLVEKACKQFAKAIIISIDVKDGFVRGRGWIEAGSLTPGKVIREMEERGVGRFIYTDIARDGTLTEPNFEGIAELLLQTKSPIIAAGGIASIDHLKRLAELGVEGAITGKAIYTGNIDVAEAIRTVK